MRIGASLVQATNLILLLSNSNTDMRKFVVWQTEGEKQTEVLQGLEIVRIAIEDQAKTFEHPIETGAVITDYEIFEPKQVSIQAYISNDDATTLKELEQLYLSGTTLKIRACNKILTNAIIASKPFEVSAEVFDKTLYSISFKEVLEVSPTYVAMPPKKVAKKSNASRVNSGVKQAKPATKKNQSWLHNAVHGNKK